MSTIKTTEEFNGFNGLENDRTIFEYLDPKGNTKFSKLPESALEEVVYYLDRYYLELRDSGFISGAMPQGTEATFRVGVNLIPTAQKYAINPNEFQELINGVGEGWICGYDVLASSRKEMAIEGVSSLLTDTDAVWEDLSAVLSFMSKNGTVNERCFSNIHIGSHILGENPIYWYRFFKLWSIYENVIYRFCYGDYLTPGSKMGVYAKPSASFIQNNLGAMEKHLDGSVLQMFYALASNGGGIDAMKNYGISPWRMYADDKWDPYTDFNKVHPDCTVVCKCMPDFDAVLKQNVVNFLIKFMLYCKRDDFDDDILEGRKIEVASIFSSIDAYSDIYLEQAVELADLIFDNNLDKVYFLRQYIKSFEKGTMPFVRAKKPITVTKYS